MDIARLGLAVDSSQVEKGTVSLKQLTGAAGQASAAARNLAGASTAEAAAQRTATAATAAHTAAIKAQGAIMRSTAQQRTMMVYQLNDVAVSLASGMNPAMVAMQQGSQILQGGFMPAVRTLGDLVGGLVTKFWPLAAVIGVASAAIAGMTNEINETSAVTVGFGDVALATWQVIAGGIYEIIRPAVELLGGWFGTAWDWVVQATKDAGNWIIRSIVGSIEYVKTSIGTLPAAFVVAGQAAAQGLADAVAGGINSIIGNINSLSAGINQLAGSEILGEIGRVNFGPIDFGGAAAQQSYEESWGQFHNTKAALGERDFMGEFFGAISGRAQEIALARQEAEALGGAASAANDNVKKLADDGLGSLQSALSGIGSGLWGAIRKGGDILGNIFDMLMSKVDSLIGKLLDSSIDNLLFGGAAGGGGGLLSGLAGPLGMLFGGARAMGGPVEPGRAYLVNENTPRSELFVPSVPGTIVPTSGVRMTSGGNTAHVTIQNHYTISGAMTDKDVANMVRAANQQTAAQVEQSIKQQLPGWQSDVQIHGAA